MPDNPPQQIDRDSDPFFGPWLRRRRRELDLTQDELAQHVGCVADTVRKLEAGMRRPSHAMAERLALCLSVPVEEHDAFLAAARAGRAPHDRTLPPIPTLSITNLPTIARRTSNLPAPMTSFIGRAWEVDTVSARLRTPEVRLVTLRGAGGIGKTRLALQIASGLHDAFPNGVWFVDLAPISDPALVISTIAQTLRVREQPGVPIAETLRAALHQQQLLLLLDNFEQVVVAAPEVAALLAEVPGIKLLVTSREALRLSGEHVVIVAPLAVPDPAVALAADHLAQYAAAQLFVARAQATSEHFRLTDANAPAVAAICARLDGLPLAIELAAAWVSLFPPAALLARLERRLPILTRGPRDVPARQQTLRNTIAWSYDLLTADEQTLFRRLAVFVGGCTIAAAEAVCVANGTVGGDILESLAAQLDKSLLKQHDDSAGEPRFVMLETIREYALERLAASGTTETIQRAHADYYLALAEVAVHQVGGGAEKLWLRRLETDYPNLRAALVWSRTAADGTTGLRLVLALDWFWRRNGYLSEGRDWLEDALTPRAGEVSRPNTAASRTLRARALVRLGGMAVWQSDLAAAQPAFEEGLALFREFGDTRSIADTLSDLGMVAVLGGDYARSGALLEQSLILFRQLEERGGIALCFFFMGTQAYAQDNLRRAGELWEQGLTLFRQLDDTWMIASSLLNLGIIALDEGENGRAGVYLVEGLTRLRELGERWQMILALETCAGLGAAQAHQRADAEGAGRRAARIFGAAEALRETLGAPRLPIYHAHYQRGVATARAQLGPATFATAWAAGRTISLEQAIADALNVILANNASSHV